MTRKIISSLSNGAAPVTNGHTKGDYSCKTGPQHIVVDALAPNPDWQHLTTSLSQELYSENVTAKILRVAESHLEDNDPPALYPELVPQSGENEGQYNRRLMDFWTCGFFPGSIYLLLERATRHPKSMRHDDSRLLLTQVRDRLEVLGFMIMPHMRPRWEMYHDREALESIRTAAVSLYSRFDARVGAIRSWDHLTWQRNVHIRDKTDNFLVIIDSLCNLELLFYAAEHTGYSFLANAATAHAKTLLRTHLRKEPTCKRDGYDGMLYSTCHVVNFLPATGEIKEVRTAQGYAPESTWSRGQAWAILGYTQTYTWTGDDAFLDAACGLAEYFLLRLENSPACVEIFREDVGASKSTKAGRYVPLWDFDAPIENTNTPLRDASAGVAAANGMLLLAQALISRGRHERANRYMGSALKIVDDTLSLSMSREQLRLRSCSSRGVSVAACESQRKPFESLLSNSTVTWNEQSFSASADHGLVYADYYLIEFGNRLLQLGYAQL